MRTIDGSDITAAGGSPSAPSRRGRRPTMGMPPATPPPPAAEATPEILTFVADAMALPEGEHNMAMDDAMQREMVLATSVLAPRAGATHVAVQDGDWSDPTTFVNADTEQFETPGAGAKVYIPNQITVTYDVDSDTVIDTIRLDGELSFATDRSTKLVVDTIIQDHGTHMNPSVFRIGTPEAPLPAEHTCEILFPGDTDMDPTVDTLLLGRGHVAMGKVFIYGAEKTAWAECGQNLSVGATSLTLGEVPQGWEVGDELTICATAPRPNNDGVNLDDEVTITDIDGATITFTPPLQYARELPTHPDFQDVRIGVVNFTRNILFHSPAGTPIHRRGHMMWMHDEVDCRYAAADWLGRTRKDVRSWNATDDARRIETMGSNIPWAPTSNVRGRYNWHLHRAGTMPGQPFVEMVGLAATGSTQGTPDDQNPGWLYAHHSSLANFRWCVGRGFFGSGLVAEIGDEIGLWEYCLMTSSGRGTNSPTSWGEKFLPDVQAGDFGRNGNGFWLRSRAPIIQNCRAYSCSTGYAWLSRGSSERPSISRLPEPRAFYGGNSSDGNTAPDLVVLHDFFGNQAAGCWTGKLVVKANANQGHSDRSYFKDFWAWNISNVGSDTDYTGFYTYFNPRFLYHPGANFRPQNAMAFTGSTQDMVVENIISVGFPAGRHISFEVNNSLVPDNNQRNIFVNPTFSPATDTPYRQLNGTPLDREAFPLFLLTPDPSEIGDRDSVLFAPSSIPRLGEFDLPQNPSWQNNMTRLSGDVTDAAGTRPRTTGDARNQFVLIDLNKTNSMLGLYGYWTHNGRRYLLIPDIITSRLPRTDGTILRQYLTVVADVDDYPNSFGNFTNNGPIPPRYLDNGEIVPVVYEDVLDILENGDMQTGIVT